MEGESGAATYRVLSSRGFRIARCGRRLRRRRGADSSAGDVQLGRQLLCSLVGEGSKRRNVKQQLVLLQLRLGHLPGRLQGLGCSVGHVRREGVQGGGVDEIP